MFMTTELVRLGQRVYGLTDYGEIVPTLINEVGLREEGVKYRFSVLDASLKHVCMRFDDALKHAVSRLQELLKDKSISVLMNEESAAYLRRLERHSQEVRNELENTTVFYEGYCGTLALLRGRNGRQYALDDFPHEYHKLGTRVWLADVRRWCLISGIVTKVSFEPRMSGSVSYTCGAHFGLPVFLTQEKALEALALAFEKKLPDTLDRSRVPVMEHLSEAEARALSFREIADTAPSPEERD